MQSNFFKRFKGIGFTSEMSKVNPAHPKYISDVQGFLNVWRYPLSPIEDTIEVIERLENLKDKFINEEKRLDEKSQVLGEAFAIASILGRKTRAKRIKESASLLFKKIRAVSRAIEAIQKRINKLDDRIYAPDYEEQIEASKDPSEFEIIRLPVMRRYLRPHVNDPAFNSVSATTIFRFNTVVSFNPKFQEMIAEAIHDETKETRLPPSKTYYVVNGRPLSHKRLIARLDFPQLGLDKKKLGYEKFEEIRISKLDEIKRSEEIQREIEELRLPLRKEFAQKAFEYLMLNPVNKEKWRSFPFSRQQELMKIWENSEKADSYSRKVETDYIEKYINGVFIPYYEEGHTPAPRVQTEYDNDLSLTTISTQNYMFDSTNTFQLMDELIKTFEKVKSKYSLSSSGIYISEIRYTERYVDTTLIVEESGIYVDNEKYTTISLNDESSKMKRKSPYKKKKKTKK